MSVPSSTREIGKPTPDAKAIRVAPQAEKVLMDAMRRRLAE
jgi:hypothetical protein